MASPITQHGDQLRSSARIEPGAVNASAAPLTPESGVAGGVGSQQVPRPPLSYADYASLDSALGQALDIGGARIEVIHGALIVSPAPRLPHQEIVGHIFAAFYNYLRQRPGAGRAYVAPVDVILDEGDAGESGRTGSGATVVQPDVVFVAAADKTSAALEDRGVVGPPDLVVEVLSPGTATYDRTYKLAVYAGAGVHEVWLVDPKARSASIHRIPTAGADADVAAYESVDQSVEVLSSPLLEGLSLPLAQVLPSAGGVEQIVELKLTDDEKAALDRSSEHVRANNEALKRILGL